MMIQPKRIRHKFLVFGIVGAIASFIDWSFFNLFYFIGANFALALSFSWAISMTFNFMINRNYTFSAKGSSMARQIPRWLVIHLIGFLSRLGIGKGVIFILGESAFNANMAFFLGLAISIPIVFFGSLFWAFKRN